MARENKTRYALLGMLALKPMTGYEMKGLINKSVKYFWNESYGQIYPMLGTLQKEGLAEGTEEPGRPPRIRYAITEAGREALRAWLAQPVDKAPLREELLLKLFFGLEARPEDLVAHLKLALAREHETLAVYQEIEGRLRAQQPPRAQTPFSLLTVRKGILNVQSNIAWCQESLALLQQKANGAAD